MEDGVDRLSVGEGRSCAMATLGSPVSKPSGALFRQSPFNQLHPPRFFLLSRSPLPQPWSTPADVPPGQSSPSASKLARSETTPFPTSYPTHPLLEVMTSIFISLPVLSTMPRRQRWEGSHPPAGALARVAHLLGLASLFLPDPPHPPPISSLRPFHRDLSLILALFSFWGPQQRP